MRIALIFDRFWLKPIDSILFKNGLKPVPIEYPFIQLFLTINIQMI